MKSCFPAPLLPRQSRVRCALTLATSALLLAGLAGCGAGVSTLATEPAAEAATPVRGNVHGGQQPVTGSHIYLYAVGAAGYGSASLSLLKAQTGAIADGSGNYYVTTDANGNFAFNVTGIACPKASTQTYVLALGGNPGFTGTVNNTAISAMVPAGKCNGIGTSSVFVLNEATTVATVTALQQFMVDATHIGGNGNLPLGIKFGFGLAADLVNPATGLTNTANVSGTGSIPNTKVNGLANALAPCLNAATAADSACSSLFAAVTPSGGTQPTDIIGAMLLMAKNPGNNVANIYGQATATPPFQPTINAAAPPQDLTLAITYSGGGMTAPGNVVIDANGSAFVSNSPSTVGASGSDSIVGFGFDGTVLTGAGGFTAGIHAPGGIAFDNAGNLWSVNAASGSSPDQIVKQTAAGALTFAFSDSSISSPQGIALDSSNNAWVTNAATSSVVKVNAAGTRTLAPVTSAGFAMPLGVGIDGSGNIFAAGSNSNTILKLSSAGSVTSPAGGYSVASLNGPLGISIDGAGNVWTINNASTITKISNTGTLITPAGPQASIANAYLLAIDGAGGAWYANCRAACGANTTSPDNLTHLLASQAQATGTADGYQDTNLSRVGTAAIDSGGNVWVTNNGNGTLTEFIGVAAPVVTPLAVAVAGNKLGTKP